jgi:hypothetical protein
MIMLLNHWIYVVILIRIQPHVYMCITATSSVHLTFSFVRWIICLLLLLLETILWTQKPLVHNLTKQHILRTNANGEPSFMCIFLIKLFHIMYRIKGHSNCRLQSIHTCRYKWRILQYDTFDNRLNKLFYMQTSQEKWKARQAHRCRHVRFFL